MRPFILAGPTLGLRGACQYGFKVAGFNAQFQCDENNETLELEEELDPVKKVDYGVMLGGGIGIRLFGLPASLQARYSRSLSTIARSPDGVEAPDVRNTAISLLIGIGF